jgi:hypothetical protein
VELMPTMHIHIVRYEDPPPWDQEDVTITEADWEVALLEGGMTSGRASVALRLDVPGVGKVIAQTSLSNWLNATAAFRGAVPAEFEGSALDIRYPIDGETQHG